MVHITHVRMSGGAAHHHITTVKWRNPSTAETGESTVADMVDFIKNKNGTAKVTDGRNTADVGVVEGNPPHIRTFADGKWTDNLLALPRY